MGVDRDIRRVLTLCVVSILLILALLWWRLRPEVDAHRLRHPQELPPAVQAAPVVARVRERVDAPRVDVDALWGPARPGEIGSDDGDDAALAANAEQDEKPSRRKFKRNRKWKKRSRKASRREIERMMQDPDDEPDDKGPDDPENVMAEKLDAASLRKMIQAEDRESQAEEEPEDALLGGERK